MTETLFSLISLLPMPIWLSMLLFPQRRFTTRLVTAYWPFIALSGVYAVLLLAALVSGGIGFDFSFHALRTNLSQEWIFLAAWAHFLAFDLFVGVWLFRDAKYYGIRPPIYLLLTLFAGPLGLLAYLIARGRRARGEPVRTLN
jgi:hypothetical protein